MQQAENRYKQLIEQFNNLIKMKKKKTDEKRSVRDGINSRRNKRQTASFHRFHPFNIYSMIKFLTCFVIKNMFASIAKKRLRKKCLYTKIEPKKSPLFKKEKKNEKEKKTSDCVHGLD